MAAKPSLVHAATCVSIAWLVSIAPAVAAAPEHQAAIAVLARFQDTPSTQVPAWTAQVFDPDRPGSFSHFYDTMSFGRHRVRGEVAARVYVAPGARADYQAGEATGVGGYGQFAREILRQVDADIDFSRFDNDGPDGVPDSGDDDGIVDAVFLLLADTPPRFIAGPATGVGHLGWEAPLATDDVGAGGKPILIDPARGTLQQARTYAEAVGSMAHEYGHVLGLPDLFDTGFLGSGSDDPAQDSAGIGAWGLMGWGALGWHGDDGPVSLSGWSRARLGWTAEEEVVSSAAQVELRDVGSGGAVVRVPVSSREYFLLEYRRRGANPYDRNIPAEGVLIWHVERTLAQGDAAPRTTVDLECADGRWRDAGFPLGVEADPDRGGDNLDFWAHDEAYRRAHGGNLGDATDPFGAPPYRAFTPETNPAARSHDGRLSVRIEEITLDGDVARARVVTEPLLVEVARVEVREDAADGTLMTGEPSTLVLTLTNRGGIAARDLRVTVAEADPALDIVRGEVAVRDLGPQSVSGVTHFNEHLQVAFSGRFVGVRQSGLVLAIYAGDALVGLEEVTLTGTSVVLPVRGVAVADSAGNGDGAAQAGEIVRLRLDLDLPAGVPLEALDVRVRALDGDVRALGGPAAVVVPGPAAGRVELLSGEFLLPAELAAGDTLVFELAVDGGYGAWRDTVAVLAVAGGDRTPPRLAAIGHRQLPGGVTFLLADGQVVEAGAVVEVWVEVAARHEPTATTRVAAVREPGHWRAPWMAPAGVYVFRVGARDDAGNTGLGPSQDLTVGADDGPDPSTGGWERLDLPTTPIVEGVLAIAVAPSLPSVVYALTERGLARSVDGGATFAWTGLMHAFLEAADVNGDIDLHVVSQDPRRVVIAVRQRVFDGPRSIYQCQLLESRDGGGTWRDVALPHDGAGVCVAGQGLETGGPLFSVDHVDNVLWRANGDLWTADGDPWTSDGDPWTSGGDLRTADGDLWMACGDGGWERVDVDLGSGILGSEPFALHHPADGGALYAGVASGPWLGDGYAPGFLWRSDDDGRTWAGGRLARAFAWMGADPAGPEQWYAVAGDTLWHSDDDGRTWAARSRRVGIGRVVVHTFAPERVFALPATIAGGAGVYRSEDGGRTWERVVPPETALRPLALTLDPTDASKAFLVTGGVGTSVGDAFLTRDAGEVAPAWQALALPPAPAPVAAVAIAPDGEVLAGSVEVPGGRAPVVGFPSAESWPVPGLAVSADGRVVWSWRSAAASQHLATATSLRASPIDAILAETTGLRLGHVRGQAPHYARSADRGMSWAVVGAAGGLSISGLRRAPRVVREPVSRRLLAVHSGLYASDDDGRTWDRAGQELPAEAFGAQQDLAGLALLPGDGGSLVCTGVVDQVWCSADAGDRWELAGRLPEGALVLDVAAGARVRPRLYVSSTQGLFASDDGARTWRRLLAPEHGVWRSARLRPGEGGALLVAAGRRLWETRDDGATWVDLAEGWPGRPWFADAVADPFALGVVYAATPRGLYRRARAGAGTAVVDGAGTTPAAVGLAATYPNPFNASTVIRYRLAVTMQTKVAVYDVLGRPVRVLAEDAQAAGEHRLVWDGRDDDGRAASTGVYLCRLQAGGLQVVAKMLLVR